MQRAILLVECTSPQVHLHCCNKSCYISHLSAVQIKSLCSCILYFSVSEGWLCAAQWGDACHAHFQGCGILPAGDHRRPCKRVHNRSLSEPHYMKGLIQNLNTLKIFSIHLGKTPEWISGFWSCRETKGRLWCSEMTEPCEDIRHTTI